MKSTAIRSSGPAPRRGGALVALCAIVLASSALGYAMLTTGHDWGDDFAAYLSQAVALLHRTVGATVSATAYTMRESSRASGPVAAPWGYPALLAPVYAACGGLNLLCLKTPNIAAFGLFLVVFFLFLRSRLEPLDALIVLAILAFNPELLRFEDNVLSDLPFLCLSTAAVWMIDRTVTAGRGEPDRWRHVLLGLILFLAFFVRTVGILLLPTLFVVQAVRQRGSRLNRWLPYVAFGAFGLLLFLVFPSGEASAFAFYRGATLDRLSGNLRTYMTEPAEFFASVPLGGVWFAVIAPFVAYGAATTAREDCAVLVYSGLMFLLLITWPADEGLRYLFPVLPFLVYVAYRGSQAAAARVCGLRRARIGRAVVRTAWLALVVAFLTASVDAVRANLDARRFLDDGPFVPVAQEMFDWVRTATPASSVVIFFKPRAMRLLTGRDAIWIDDCGQLGRGDYVVIRKAGGASGQVLPGGIASCNPSLTVTKAFENVDYVAYRISRS